MDLDEGETMTPLTHYERRLMVICIAGGLAVAAMTLVAAFA